MFVLAVVALSVVSVFALRTLVLRIALIVASAAAIGVVPTKAAAQPVYSIALAPLLPSATTQVGSTGTANYQLSNTSTGTQQPLFVDFSVIGCTLSIGCSPPPSMNLLPGQSITLSVVFNGNSMTSSAQPVALTASASAPDGSRPSATAIVGATVTSHVPLARALLVTPIQSASSAAVGASSMARYLVQNTSVGEAPNYQLPVTLVLSTCPNPNFSCGQMPGPISLTQGAAQIVSINYTGMNPTSAARALTLTASSGPVSSTGTVNVTITGGPIGPPVFDYSITATPSSSSTELFATGAATYVVKNISTNAWGTIGINLSIGNCNTSIMWCESAPDLVELAQGDSQIVSVAYHTMQVTGSPVALSLTGLGFTPNGPLMRSGAVSVSVMPQAPPPLAPWVSVGGSAPGPVTIAQAGGGVMSFGVSNGSPSQTVTYSASCGGLASCTVWPATETLGAYSMSNAWIIFSASPGQAGPFSVSLTATGPGGSNTATSQVTVQPPPPNYLIGIAANPASSTTAQNTYGVATYRVQNVSTNSTLSLPINFQVQACAGSITPCAVPQPITLAPGAVQNVTVSYYGASAVSNTPLNLTASATAPDGSHPTTTTSVLVTVTGAPPAVYTISLIGSPGTSSTTQGSPGTATYTVQNTSTNSSGVLPISFQVTNCPANITPCPAPSSISLGQGASQNVSVTYAGGVVGSNLPLSLTASATAHDGVHSQTASVLVTVNATSSGLVVSSAQEFPNGAITRDACLSISAGDNAAYECGALRIVHPLPATTTYGKARTPTLIYSSNHAAPGVILAGNVSFTGSTQPTSIIVTAKLGGRQIQRTFAWNPAWTDGLSRRISIPVDAVVWTLTDGKTPVLFVDTVEFKAMNGASNIDTKLITGVASIVDRRESPFGAGWWLEGLEQFTSVNATQKLWVGGDGSTRVYTQQAGSNIWLLSPAITRPDTLEYLPSLAVWRRHLPNGAFVEFGTNGRHVRTSDALGRITTLQDTVVASRTVLRRVVLPVQSGSAPTYVFFYTPDVNGIPRLDSITAPATHVGRKVGVYASTGWVTDIQDPIGLTSFIYNGSHQLIKRLSKLRDTTAYVYDEAGLLRSASLDMRRTNAAPAPLSIGQSFCAAESRSVTTCGGGAVDTPLLTTKAYTLLDGPRTDVLDTTIFFVNRFGAPDTVVNALAHRTRVKRNAMFPLLVDTMIAPSGLKSASTFSGRGLALTTTVFNPHGTGDAVTTYQWDDTLDLPVSILSPSGVLSTRQYNRATRTLTWAQSGGDTTRFTYVGGLVTSVLRVANGATENLTYDVRGNLLTHTAPLSGTTSIVRDAIGRDSIVTVPVVGSTTQTLLTLFDNGGRDTLNKTIGGSEVLAVRNRYDYEGNLLSVTQSGSSDPNAIGQVTHTFGYDAAGRQITDSLSGSDGPIRNNFDAAGNLTSGGRTLAGKTTTYDVLNRPVHTFSGYGWSDFTYDTFGRLQTANNPFAQISRGYDASGALIADTLRIATVGAQPNTANDYSQHQYAFGFSYDPSGRRRTMTQPSALGGGMTQYAYDDPRTGALALVTDPAGIKYRYHYDVLGRLDSLVRRSGLSDSVPESWTFDLESRVATRRAVVGTDVMLSDGFTYDKQGRVIRATGSDTVAYDLFGHTTYSKVSGISERITLDLLGNRVSKVGVQPHGAGGSDLYAYAAGTARLKFINRSGGVVGDTTFYNTDFLGNVYAEAHRVWSPESATSNNAGYHVDEFTPDWFLPNYPIGGQNQSLAGVVMRLQSTATQSFYDEDNRVVRTSFTIDTLYGANTLPPNLPVVYRASEEYRYDALGRRVWVRVLRDSTCAYAQRSTRCLNSVTRVLWDGDQIAGEIRASDTTTVALNGDTDAGAGLFSGVVSYTHGGGVDHPLGLTKLNGLTVYPLTDWRGSIGSGVCKTSGLAAARCAVTSVLFPLRAAGIFGAAQSTVAQGVPGWYGSLIEGMRDGSGKVYQRNRYLDPETGRFTQEDPIGLAGGMNLYGFADGDPVNFGDPFGLCPPRDENTSDCAWMHEEGLQSGGLADPILWLSGGIAAEIERGLAMLGAKAVTNAGTRVAANKAAGDAFRDKIASAFENNGYDVTKEVGKKTPFGRRVIDVEVSKTGRVLGGIEAKAGKSRYLPWQMAKDEYLRRTGYPVQVVRDATSVKISGIPPQ